MKKLIITTVFCLSLTFANALDIEGEIMAIGEKHMAFYQSLKEFDKTFMENTGTSLDVECDDSKALQFFVVMLTGASQQGDSPKFRAAVIHSLSSVNIALALDMTSLATTLATYNSLQSSNERSPEVIAGLRSGLQDCQKLMMENQGLISSIAQEFAKAGEE